MNKVTAKSADLMDNYQQTVKIGNKMKKEILKAKKQLARLKGEEVEDDSDDQPINFFAATQSRINENT